MIRPVRPLLRPAAEDVVFEYVITVPGYPRRVEGRAAVAELYRPYGDALVLDRCYDLAVHHDPDRCLRRTRLAAPLNSRTGRW
jgi:hypothetical protein